MDLKNDTYSTHFNWSSEVIIISLITVVIVLGVTLSLNNLSFIKVTLIVSIILIPAAFAPLRLSINSENIVFKKLLGKITINLRHVKSVNQIKYKDIDNSIRTFGSGGLYGYLGYFKNQKLGNYIMYATERKNLICITTIKKKYVFSCSDPKGFVEFANKLLNKTINHGDS